jgi:uncharacterized protein YprB with RNaseH-like and TPR domain
MLRDVIEVIEGKKMITYNGRTFDEPVLSDRMYSHMMPHEIPIHHRDLYQEFRKLVKKHNYKASSLKLSRIPEKFMKCHPHNEVPSKEVPTLYKMWLNTGNPEYTADNIEHNVVDLLKTISLRVSPKYFGNT